MSFELEPSVLRESDGVVDASRWRECSAPDECVGTWLLDADRKLIEERNPCEDGDPARFGESSMGDV